MWPTTRFPASPWDCGKALEQRRGITEDLLAA